MLFRNGRALWRGLIGLTLVLSTLASFATARPALAASSNLVISQIYGAGGNAGATLRNDYVEIFNRGTAAVSIAGLSIQYASATGTGNFGANPVVGLSGTLNPGQYYLVQLSGGANGSALPTANAIGTINAATGAGKFALVNGTTGLACNGGSTPCSAAQLAQIIDLVGYGTGASGANFFEGAGPAPTISATTAGFRAAGGCTDTDNNNADFSAAAPAPRNTSSALNPCGPATPVVSISATDAGAGEASGDTGTFQISRTGNTVSALTVSYTISGSASAADYTPTLTGSATILSNQSSAEIVIVPVDDVVFEGDETVTLTLSDGADYDLGVSGSATVTIVDNDAPDAPPVVTSTVPANGASNVSLNQNISVNFSEPVNVSDPWFTLSCATSGAHPASVSDGPSSFTLNPTTDFVYGEQCSLTILAGQVRDQDGNDPPDTMVIDFVVGFTTQADPCTLPFTPISSIQGSGASAAITGNLSTKGVVVGDFGGSTAVGLQGFYLQDPTGDGDPATSDGIFVYTGNSDLVSAGQLVRVTGFARERFGMTAINGSDNNTSAVPAASIVVCGSGSVSPTDMELPFASATAPERYEGMLVRLPQALQITEYFNFDQFGEIVLGLPLPGEPRIFTPTAVEEPGTAAAATRASANSLRRITLDDGRGVQNPNPARHPNGAEFTLSNRFRGGDLVKNTVGVLSYDFSIYRIQPTGAADYFPTNPRPAAPEPVGGSLKISAFNTLNYFLTLDYPSGNPLDNKCGPANTLECRGADSDQPTEFSRQRAKLLAAIQGIDADVLGLNELENSTGAEPLADIVGGMNDTLGAGTYAFINTGTIGTDAIKVGLIYKPAKVTPVGGYALLTSAVDPNFIDTRNRPVLAQTFEENATGARFTVAVAHLKSKGSGCGSGDDDTSVGGAGNCNLTRTKAAEALVDWLAADPTASGDPDFLIVGDLNSYSKEDPIDAILAGADDTLGTSDDYTNLILQYQGPFAYSYVFDGQFGYLDQALASASMALQVTGAADWHINADEPDLLDYDTSFKQPAQDALYEPNAYRTSDHDPVQVGLIANAPPTIDAGGPYSVAEGGSVTLSATGSDSTYATDLQYAWDLDNNGSFETAGQSVSFSAAALDGPTSATVGVRVTDELGLSASTSVVVVVTNVAPSVSASFNAAGGVSCGANNATLTVSFSDPAAADTHSAAIVWGDGSTQTVASAVSPLSLAHSYAAAGTYTATVTVTDDDGAATPASATVVVNYTVVGGGVLQPLNQDGSSIVKYGSTIPVKIRLENCDGSTPANLAPTIRLTILSGGVPVGEINEPISTSAADTSGVMRFSSQQYIYNLATKPLPDSTATYRITITVPATGQTITVQFGLK